MKFTIFGEPIAKMRPRFFVRGKHVSCYDPQEKEKKQVQKEIIAQLHEAMNSSYKEIALEASRIAQAASYTITLHFYMSIPKGAPKHALNAMLWNWEKCISKKDLDNCEKFLLDTLNGILYSDDHLITEIHSEKLYSSEPRTEIEIMANPELNYNQTREVILHFSPTELEKLEYEAQYLSSQILDALLPNAEEIDQERLAKRLFDFSKKYAPVMTKISKLKFDEENSSNKTVLRGLKDYESTPLD